MNTLLDLVYVGFYYNKRKRNKLFILDLNVNQYLLIYQRMKIIQRCHLFIMIYDPFYSFFSVLYIDLYTQVLFKSIDIITNALQ